MLSVHIYVVKEKVNPRERRVKYEDVSNKQNKQ